MSLQTKNNNKSKLKETIGKLLQKQESSIIIAIIAYIIFVSCINPTFASSGNAFNILRSSGFTLITAVGMTLVLITGGLDLSIGSVLALGGVVSSMLAQAGYPIILCIIAGMLVGAVIGSVNGYIIVKAGIPPLIVTLGMQYVARGAVSIITEGIPVYPLPDSFKAIEQGDLFGIPTIIIIAGFLAIVGHIVLAHTSFGRSVFALGGNEECARISGINTRKTKFIVYVIISTLAALAGVFMSARLGSAEAAAGTGYEMTVICGAIIGGTSSFGGMGSILGTTVGAIFMEVLTNSLTMMRISVYWQNLVVGVILVLAVLLDQYKRNLILKNSIKKD